jgi:hypothetical protein
MSMTKVSDDFDKTLDALFTADEERQRREKKQAGEARIVRQKSVGEFLSFREKVIRPLLENAARGLKQRDCVCVIEESNDEQPAITLSIPAEKSFGAVGDDPDGARAEHFGAGAEQTAAPKADVSDASSDGPSHHPYRCCQDDARRPRAPALRSP